MSSAIVLRKAARTLVTNAQPDAPIFLRIWSGSTVLSEFLDLGDIIRCARICKSSQWTLRAHVAMRLFNTLLFVPWRYDMTQGLVPLAMMERANADGVKHLHLEGLFISNNNNSNSSSSNSSSGSASPRSSTSLATRLRAWWCNHTNPAIRKSLIAPLRPTEAALPAAAASVGGGGGGGKKRKRADDGAKPPTKKRIRTEAQKNADKLKARERRKNATLAQKEEQKAKRRQRTAMRQAAKETKLAEIARRLKEERDQQAGPIPMEEEEEQESEQEQEQAKPVVAAVVVADAPVLAKIADGDKEEEEDEDEDVDMKDKQDNDEDEEMEDSGSDDDMQKMRRLVVPIVRSFDLEPNDNAVDGL